MTETKAKRIFEATQRALAEQMPNTPWPSEMAQTLWLDCKCGARFRLPAKDFHLKRCRLRCG